MRAQKPTQNILVYCSLAPSVALMLWQSAAWFLYEATGPLCWDASIFMAVGRGMLNGYLPYADLYENKPPGVFLIAAASLYLFDSQALAAVLETSILFWFPFLFGRFAWRRTRGWDEVAHRAFLATTACLYGTVLAVYTLHQAGQFEAESFGALFGLGYLAVAVSPGRMGAGRIVLAGLLLLASVGTKEPFVLTLLAGMLVYFNGRLGELRRRFLLPLAVAIALGVTALVMMGILGPYLELYLVKHMPDAVHGSRVGSVAWAANHLADTVAAIGRNLGWGVRSLPLLILLLAALTLREAAGSGRPQGSVWGRLAVVLFAFAVAVYTVTLRKDVYGHQYVFLVPLYAGMGFRVIGALADGKFANAVWKSVALYFLCSITLGTLAGALYVAGAIRYDTIKVMEGKAVAATVDRVLENCRVPRYFSLSGIERAHPVAFTRHSPLGPLPLQMANYLMGDDYRSGFLSALHSALVVLRARGSMPALHDLAPLVDVVIESDFTADPPACAAGIPMDEMADYRLYYRKSYEGFPPPSNDASR